MNITKTKKAIVISAYPGLGKTYATDYINRETDFEAIDSDSSYFSWLYDANGEKQFEILRMGQTKNLRDPNFPQNYINYIKANIAKKDVIFVSSHLSVRQLMEKEGIDFYVAVPEPTDLMRDEIRLRFINRGNTPEFIDDQFENYFSRVNEMINSTKEGKLITLHSGEFLIDHIVSNLSIAL